MTGDSDAEELPSSSGAADETRAPAGADTAKMGGVPLTDAAFPGFDVSSIPPRPPLPGTPAPSQDESTAPEDPHPRTGDHGAIREQLRAARDDFESHVSHARDQLEQTNERIKQRTGRDLIVAIGIGIAFGVVFVGSLVFFKWLFLPLVLAAALLATYELSRAMRAGGREVDIVPQMISATAIILAGFFADAWLSWVVVFAAVAFVSVWRMIAQMLAKDGRTYGDVLGRARRRVHSDLHPFPGFARAHSAHP